MRYENASRIPTIVRHGVMLHRLTAAIKDFMLLGRHGLKQRVYESDGTSYAQKLKT